MKTNIDKYESEKVWVKLIFWTGLIMWIFIYLQFSTNLYSDVIFSVIDDNVAMNVWCFLFGTLMLLPIFFVKDNFKSWIKIPIIFFVLAAANLFLREESRQLDFFMTGPRPTTLYIYTIGFMWSLFIIFKNK